MVSSLAPLFLILLLTVCMCTATATTLNDTCTNVTGFVPYSFCLATLQSNPRSLRANTTTLAFITLNMAIINATTTKLKINTLLNATREPELKNGLQACTIVYANAVVDLTSAGDFLRRARFDTAKALVSAASTAGNECADALRRVKSVANVPRRRRLFQKENGDFGLLTLLFLGVVNPLL